MRAEFVLVNQEHGTTEQIEVCMHDDSTLEIHRYRPDATDQLIAVVSLADALVVTAGSADTPSPPRSPVLVTENPYPI